MKRALRTGMISAAILLSGTVAFAVAASTAPPSVDRIRVVVTDRAVREFAISPARVGPTVSVTATETVPPTSTSSSAAPVVTFKTVVKSVVLPKNRPQNISVPGVTAPTGDTDKDASSHEVVTPPVRDDTDGKDGGSQGSSDSKSTSTKSLAHKSSTDSFTKSSIKGD